MATTTIEREKLTIGAYRVESGPRELVALIRRADRDQVAIDGIVDRPAGGTEGQVYVVERDVRAEDSVKALVNDYVKRAEDLGHCPMSRAGIAEVIDRGFLGREDA